MLIIVNSLSVSERPYKLFRGIKLLPIALSLQTFLAAGNAPYLTRSHNTDRYAIARKQAHHLSEAAHSSSALKLRSDFRNRVSVTRLGTVNREQSATF